MRAQRNLNQSNRSGYALKNVKSVGQHYSLYRVTAYFLIWSYPS
jgi:hypothetical protein